MNGAGFQQFQEFQIGKVGEMRKRSEISKFSNNSIRVGKLEFDLEDEIGG